MKNMQFLAYIFFIILSMCAMELAENLTPIHFCQSLHDRGSYINIYMYDMSKANIDPVKI